MKDKIKGLIIGILISSIIFSTGVLATVGSVRKELFYNDIKITLDNQKITPTDASGGYVEPFIIDGTTYLPVRAVSNALGLSVDWDENTNTVKLLSQEEFDTENNSDNTQDTNTILTGKNTYTGTMKVEDLSCYLQLDHPISYQESLGNSPIRTSAELWFPESYANDFKAYNGVTVTLEGTLFDYRGGGTLMFESMPTILNVQGTPNAPSVPAIYENWDSTDNETIFSDALEVLRTIIYRCEDVYDVRTLCDLSLIEKIKENGFSWDDNIMLQINGSWVSEYDYAAYITPQEDKICISVGPNDGPSIPIWEYSWDGELLYGEVALEAYLQSQGLVR